MQPPRNAGFGGFNRLSGDFDAGPKLATRALPRSLVELSRTHAIFTYSLLFLYGGLRHNPVQAYLNETGLGRVVELMLLPFKLFEELHDPWGYVLWTCPLEHWDGLMMDLGSTACLDRSKRWFSRPIYQEFMAWDLAHAVNNPAAPDQVFPLSAFGVDASYGYCLFDPRQPMPTVMKMDPDPRTVEMALLLFNEDADVSSVVRAFTAGGFDVHPFPGSSPE